MDKQIEIHNEEIEKESIEEKDATSNIEEKDATSNKKEKESNGFKKEIFNFIKLIVIAFIIAWGLNNYVIVNATIPTESMENTIMVGDRIYAFRLSYLFVDPSRGDIIVFPFPDNEKEKYIKRIIGLPGETVEGIDGIVYVDGKPLDEIYVKDQIEDDFGPFEVPEDSYFMMGDYRSISEDSRYWIQPFVKKEKILGKAIIKYYPNIELLD